MLKRISYDDIKEILINLALRNGFIFDKSDNSYVKKVYPERSILINNLNSGAEVETISIGTQSLKSSYATGTTFAFEAHSTIKYDEDNQMIVVGDYMAFQLDKFFKD